jgi:hypothetical protein
MFLIRQLTSPHQNMAMADYKEVVNIIIWPRQFGSINKQETVDLPVLIGNNRSPISTYKFPFPNLQLLTPLATHFSHFLQL